MGQIFGKSNPVFSSCDGSEQISLMDIVENIISSNEVKEKLDCLAWN